MVTARFWQKGQNVDYKNKTENTINSGTVLPFGDRIVISGGDIPAGDTGAVITVGVFVINKANANDVIERGSNVFYDGTGIVTMPSAPAENAEAAEKSAYTEYVNNLVHAGWAVEDSDATDETVLVKIG